MEADQLACSITSRAVIHLTDLVPINSNNIKFSRTHLKLTIIHQHLLNSQLQKHGFQMALQVHILINSHHFCQTLISNRSIRTIAFHLHTTQLLSNNDHGTQAPVTMLKILVAKILKTFANRSTLCNRSISKNNNKCNNSNISNNKSTTCSPCHGSLKINNKTNHKTKEELINKNNKKLKMISSHIEKLILCLRPSKLFNRVIKSVAHCYWVDQTKTQLKAISY